MTIASLRIDGREYVVIPKEEFEAWRSQTESAHVAKDRAQQLQAFLNLAGQDVIDPDALAELREASRT